jgi:RNA polymerase sigma-70 factor, ECF subfamily
MTRHSALKTVANGTPAATSGADRAVSPVTPDFPEVLEKARSGADWAMAVLFRDFNPALMRQLKMADPVAYEDLVAEVWISVLGAIGSFQGDEDDFRGWLYTIARNRLIDLRRRTARRPVSSVPDDELNNRNVQADPGEELTERLHAQKAMHRLISKLPDTHSRVVVLRVVDGLEVADVARIMGRSPGWVRVTQHRALVRLGQLMDGRRWDGES